MDAEGHGLGGEGVRRAHDVLRGEFECLGRIHVPRFCPRPNDAESHLFMKLLATASRVPFRISRVKPGWYGALVPSGSRNDIHLGWSRGGNRPLLGFCLRSAT